MYTRDTLKYTYTAKNGYTLEMEIGMDRHVRITQDQADAINEAENAQYLIQEAAANGIQQYTGKIRISSKVCTPSGTQVQCGNMADHAIDELNDKYLEVYKLLEKGGLGTDINGSMAPLGIIHELDYVKQPVDPGLAGIYRGIPYFYQVETRKMNRELAEMRFAEAMEKTDFEQAKSKHTGPGEDSGWAAGR